MKSKKIIRVMWLLFWGTTFISYMVSCDKSTAPDVTTKEVTEITANSAKTGGVIDDDHGDPVIRKGVVWNTEGNPTYSENEGRTDDGDGMGEYNSIMTNLTSKTTYYVRAYAISSEGTGYGDEVMFETLERTGPYVTTKEVTEIMAYSAKSGGIIDDDHGEPIIRKGIVWNTEGNPTYNDNEGRTDDGDGMGEYSSIMTNLTPATTYYVRAYAISSEGTGYGNDVTFETLEGDPTVEDIDGNVYRVVTIGSQEWLVENLRVTRYNNGDAIPTGLSNAEWGNTTSGAYVVYPNGSIDGLNSDAEVVSAYGKLYNWYSVADSRGLCPEGWSVPRDVDFTVLVNYVVSEGFPNEQDNPNGAGNALKSCRQVGHPDGGDCDTTVHPRYNSHDTHSGFDEFRFSSLPGGFRWHSGSFHSVGSTGNWWSATEASGTNAWLRVISIHSGRVGRLDDGNKRAGRSIRCFRDIDN